MQEFASALLVRLVRSELAARGLLPTSPVFEGRILAEATVALEPKRDLLSRVAAAHGLVPLMEVGRGLSRLPPDPALDALMRASDPHDAFARWRRLERYLHSRHRLVLEESGARHVVVRHAAAAGHPPPLPGEDALILGVLAELCRLVGAHALSVALLEGGEQTVLEDGVFSEPAIAHYGQTGLWRFAWGAAPEGMSDRPMLKCSCQSVTADGAALTPGRAVALRDPAATLAAVRAAILADLTRSWTLSLLARQLATSERTLQRRLQEAGASVAALVRSARVEAAGRMLIETDHGLAKIGFACGFSDQPHFTALFKRQTALTPAAYRKAFA